MPSPTSEPLEEEGLLLADGLEEAFIGIASIFTQEGQREVAAYDSDECIAVLMSRDGMSYEEAEEFFTFNTLGAYVGPQTPVFIQLKSLSEVLEERS